MNSGEHLKKLLARLEKELLNRDEQFSIVLIDIDFFIRYCMRFSEKECYIIINNIVQFLKSELSQTTILYEIGTDEIAVILDDESADEAKIKMNLVLKRFRKQRFLSFLGEYYKKVRITFSAGIAAYPDNGSKNIILKKAVTALFTAKSLRRNHISCYEEDIIYNDTSIIYNENLSVETIVGEWGEIGDTHSKRIKGQECFLWEPQAIAVDEKGNLYIADQNNHQILCYKKGYVSNVAGNGSFGYSGDESEAVKAHLNKPTGLYVCKNKLYITDTGNDVVRMVDLKTNIITTICGTGQAGYSGDGGYATCAKLNKPGGIVVSKQNEIYINDIANNVIRKINEKGIITTFAGDGVFGYSGDGEKAVDASFNEIYNIGIDNESRYLYIVDYLNNRIRKVSLLNNHIETCAGNGSRGDTIDNVIPAQTNLNAPVAVCFDYQDNMYIAESGRSSVRIVSVESNKIYTLVGGNSNGSEQTSIINNYKLANPNGLAVYRDVLYILDGANNRICSIKLNFLGGENI